METIEVKGKGKERDPKTKWKREEYKKRNCGYVRKSRKRKMQEQVVAVVVMWIGRMRSR